MNSTEEIHPIFPIPIFKKKLDRKFSKEELSFIHNKKKEVYNNDGNIYTKDTFILNNIVLKNLKSEIDLNIKKYVDNIISPKDNIEFYITQSWINFTTKNGFHSVHNHPNSFISGVVYVNTYLEEDSITFHNDRYEAIKFSPKTLNIFNVNIRYLNVSNNDIVIFPSFLNHSVKINNTNTERISIAFNVFFKGKINDEKSLFQLDIK
jgi:uncharacterized protein (TIGR02466 family)